MLKYFLLFLFIVHWSCEESEDSKQQNDTIIGSWNFVSQNRFSDYECTEPDDEWEFDLPGVSITGFCNISDNDISISTNYAFTKEWMCAAMGGTLLEDGNTCGSYYYYGSSINIDEYAEEICNDLTSESSNGTWNASTGTCSMEQNNFATYTLNSDATLMYLNLGRCDCESDNCYSESEIECNSFGGEWIIENDTSEISMNNDNLTIIDKNKWDVGFCDCEDTNDTNCNFNLNESECESADGHFQEDSGEDCHIIVYTKN